MRSLPATSGTRIFLAGALALAAGAARAELLCLIQGSDIDFGVYSVMDQAPRIVSTNLTVTCRSVGGSSQGVVRVAMGPSAHSNVVNIRRMGSHRGRSSLDYNIYVDPGLTVVWGDSPGINTAAQPVNLAPGASIDLKFPLYARIYPLQDVEPGAYTDVLRVTVTF